MFMNKIFLNISASVGKILLDRYYDWRKIKETMMIMTIFDGFYVGKKILVKSYTIAP